MTKQQVIQELMDIKSELQTGETFKGRASLIKKIRRANQFLTMYKVEDRIANLILKEINDELSGYQKQVF